VREKYIGYNWVLPDGYRIVSYSPEVDLAAWADLLNSEGAGFGEWSADRVRDEIVSKIVSPDLTAFIYYKDTLVGCGVLYDCSTKKVRMCVGMWLLVHKAHRGNLKLAHAITYRAMSFATVHGYAKVFAYTDPYRLPVLYFYLTTGVIPEYNSLYSVYKWWSIKRKLRPLLERAKKRARG
jgi:hypothetical protein